MTPDSIPTVHDLADAQQPQRPVARLCSLILEQALLTKASAVRLQLTEDARGGIEYAIGDEWKAVMQVPRAVYAPLVARLREMAGLSGDGAQDGQMRIRHHDIHRLLAVHVGAGAEPAVMITGLLER